MRIVVNGSTGTAGGPLAGMGAVVTEQELLCEPIDEKGADLAIHGHAHYGCEQGVTPGGVRVRNVAQPVIRAAYATYVLAPETVNA